VSEAPARPKPQAASLIQILDDVGRVFQVDGEADHAVGDAELGAGFAREARVGRRRRMSDQALGVAEVVGDVDQVESVEEAERSSAALPSSGPPRCWTR